jgi:RNA polymerase sigma-70 factor (ECF subfamily)
LQPITTERETVGQSDSTTELVRRSQQGDAEAFEALYRQHSAPVFALCSRMSGDSQRAAELTQDVFVRAWRSLGGFRAEASFGTWLHRIAFNVVREHQRGDRRRRLRIMEKNEDGTTVDGIDNGGLSEDARIDLERAIAQLPNRARNALVLHDIHGYRCREVAELTGCAVGTIQAHLHRARRLLREILEK